MLTLEKRSRSVTQLDQRGQIPNGQSHHLSIQVEKYGRAPAEFDVVQLAKATEGLTGSEIEQVLIEALYQAFDDGQKEPSD